MDKKECPIRLVASYLMLSQGLNSAKEGQDAIDLKYCVEDQCPLWVPLVLQYIDPSVGKETEIVKPGYCGLKKQ